MSLRRGRLNFCAVLAVLAVVSACAQKSAPVASSAGGAAPTMAPMVAGTALPPGYKIDSGRTLILGADDRWTGRLSYSTSTSADDTFDFLRREMPNFGWSETAAMRSDISVLTFTSENTGRVAVVHIERGGMLGGGVHVDMVVSPRDTPARSGAPSTARAPAH